MKSGIINGVHNGIIPQYNKIVTRGSTIAQTNRYESPVMDMLQWIRADRGITYNGANASVWGDLSGHGYDFSQGTASKQPLPTLNVLNGRPGMYFDGGDSMKSTFPTTIIQPLTVFCVFKSILLATQLMFDGIDVTNRAAFYIDAYGGGYLHIGNASYDMFYYRPVPILNIFTLIFNGATSQIYENGVLKKTSNILISNLNGITLGADYSGSTYYLTGYIFEKITYNRLLSTNENQHNLLYLQKRYVL